MQPSRLLARAGAMLLVLGQVSPAKAEPQREWDPTCGCWIMCVSCPSTPTGNDDDDYVYTPPFDQFSVDFQAYDTALRRLQSATPLAQYFASLPPPGNDAELSARLDNVFASLWPEFSSATLEAQRLRNQVNFLEGRLRESREEEARMHGRIGTLAYEAPALRQQIVDAESALAFARNLEAEVSSIALAQINDRSSERQATAVILAFAPEPGYPPDWLDREPGGYLYPESGPEAPRFEGAPVPPPASLPEPSFDVTMTFGPPSPGAPVGEKIAVLHRIGETMYYDTSNLPYWRSEVPNLRAQYMAQSQANSMLYWETERVEREFRALGHQFDFTQEHLAVSRSNAVNASARIVTEVVADMALGYLSGRLRGIIDEIAGSEGLEVNVPANGTEALLTFTRRGGRMLLPVEGYEAQWDAFIEVQGITQSLLGTGNDFMTQAAHAAAQGTPEEMEAVMERVFAFVDSTTLDYVWATGFSALPEGEDRPVIADAFRRYFLEVRERESDQ